MLEKCWTCDKEEEYEGEHFIGQCPFGLAFCVDDADRDDVTDKEVICDQCYTNKVGDI